MKWLKRICTIITLSLTLFALSGCANKEAKDFKFGILEDGTYYISDYFGNATKVEIPAKHNGIDITAIGEKAFAETEIQSVSGGKNLTTIEENAFANCYMLKSIDFDREITHIHSRAFYKCTNLSEISFPKSLEYLGSGVFMECRSLKTITIPDSVYEMGSSMFEGCLSLESVKIPEALTSIPNRCFYNCENLRTIDLPESLKGIGYEAFKNCTALSNITIPATVTSVKEGAFNTGLTICVEGSTAGWSGSWCSSRANVVYLNKETPLSDVDVKFGTYNGTIITETLGTTSVIEQSLYIDNKEIIFMRKSGALLIGVKYTYEIEGNILHCTPQKGEYEIVDITYDELAESLEWGTNLFFWSSSEKTKDNIYYE